MPSKSAAQARTMRAIAHGWVPPAKSGINIPVKVAREFAAADKKVDHFADGGKIEEPESYADGGMVKRKPKPKKREAVDNIPIMATKGEYMLPVDTTRAVGKKNLDALIAATHTPVNAPKTKKMPMKPMAGIQAKAEGGSIRDDEGFRQAKAAIEANPIRNRNMFQHMFSTPVYYKPTGGIRDYLSRAMGAVPSPQRDATGNIMPATQASPAAPTPSAGIQAAPSAIGGGVESKYDLPRPKTPVQSFFGADPYHRPGQGALADFLHKSVLGQAPRKQPLTQYDPAGSLAALDAQRMPAVPAPVPNPMPGPFPVAQPEHRQPGIQPVPIADTRQAIDELEATRAIRVQRPGVRAMTNDPNALNNYRGQVANVNAKVATADAALASVMPEIPPAGYDFRRRSVEALSTRPAGIQPQPTSAPVSGNVPSGEVPFDFGGSNRAAPAPEQVLPGSPVYNSRVQTLTGADAEAANKRYLTGNYEQPGAGEGYITMGGVTKKITTPQPQAGILPYEQSAQYLGGVQRAQNASQQLAELQGQRRASEDYRDVQDAHTRGRLASATAMAVANINERGAAARAKERQDIAQQELGLRGIDTGIRAKTAGIQNQIGEVTLADKAEMNALSAELGQPGLKPERKREIERLLQIRHNRVPKEATLQVLKGDLSSPDRLIRTTPEGVATDVTPPKIVPPKDGDFIPGPNGKPRAVFQNGRWVDK